MPQYPFPAGYTWPIVVSLTKIAFSVRRQHSPSAEQRVLSPDGDRTGLSLWKHCLALELASENIRVNALCPLTEDDPKKEPSGALRH